MFFGEERAAASYMLDAVYSSNSNDVGAWHALACRLVCYEWLSTDVGLYR